VLAVDTSTPSLARAYDHLLGGRANFAADRSLAARLSQLYPRTSALLSLSRTYTATAVAACAAGGVAQFIDVGCGLPTSPAVHEAALRARREARVVYVDRDPAVVAHAAALVPRTVRVIEGDLAEPEALLWSMRPLLDLSRPACLVLALVVQALPDAGLARAVVDVLVRGLAPGSCLIMTAGHGDDGRLPDGVTGASLAERDFESFFAGLDLLPPGVEAGLVLRCTGRKP
jgi:hypothetical protein